MPALVNRMPQLKEVAFNNWHKDRYMQVLTESLIGKFVGETAFVGADISGMS